MTALFLFYLLYPQGSFTDNNAAPTCALKLKQNKTLKVLGVFSGVGKGVHRVQVHSQDE